MEKRTVVMLIEKQREINSKKSWFPFVLPMGVFLVLSSIEPKPNSEASWISIPISFYPWIYAGKLFITLVALCLVWTEYRPLMRSIGWKGIACGIIGGILWIALCSLEWEQSTLHPLLRSLRLEGVFGSSTRSAFNPFIELKGNTFGILMYLAVRGAGLILVVPVIEEYFLRAFLMRFFASEEWWAYPIGRVTFLSAILGTSLPMLMHPDELLAAAFWFSWITVLAWHSKNLWECIAAHCVTNLIVGTYVIAYGAWRLV